MSEFKHVTDVSCKKGLMSSRVEVIMKRDTSLPSELVQQIALAVDHLVSGRTLVLSGEAIQMHTAVDIGLHTHQAISEANHTVNLQRELQLTRDELVVASRRSADLQKEVNAGLKREERLQEVIDNASNSIRQLHHSSTFNKEARERFAKRHRNG